MIRAGVVVLAILQGFVGLVQLFAPRTFYDLRWVSLLPPYNEHLMRDVGALTLAYVLVLAAAAIWPERRLTRVALSANLVWTVPHLVFHATHLDHFSTGDAVGQTTALAIAVVLPATLLALTWRTPRSGLPARHGVVVTQEREKEEM